MFDIFIFMISMDVSSKYTIFRQYHKKILMTDLPAGIRKFIVYILTRKKNVYVYRINMFLIASLLYAYDCLEYS